MVTFKNPALEEFSALMQTLEDRGLRAADAARLINKTPGAVSQYLSGKTNPSEATLELFRLKVKEIVGTPQEKEVSDKEVNSQLDDLRRLSPPDYEVAKTTIRLLHQKLPVNSEKIQKLADTQTAEAIRTVRKRHKPFS